MAVSRPDHHTIDQPALRDRKVAWIAERVAEFLAIMLLYGDTVACRDGACKADVLCISTRLVSVAQAEGEIAAQISFILHAQVSKANLHAAAGLPVQLKVLRIFVIRLATGLYCHAVASIAAG